MIVKKYIANTVEEAQAVIATELGPKAVTLTLRYVKQTGWKALFAANRVEVTAAIEEEQLQEHNAATLFKKSAESTSESGSLGSNLSDLKKLFQEEEEPQEDPLAGLKNLLKEEEEPQQDSLANLKNLFKEEKKSPVAATYGDPRFRSKKAKSQSGGEMLSAEEEQRALRKLESLRRATAQPPSAPKPSAQPQDFGALAEGLVGRFGGESEHASQPSEPASQLQALRQFAQKETVEESPAGETKFLMTKGVDRAIANQIENGIGSLPDKERLNAVKASLSAMIQTSGPITLKNGAPTIVAIVGPTGVGKTTTLAKIAGQYAGQLGKKIGIISLDNVKVGAREQIKGLCAKEGYPCATASNSFELKQAISNFGDRDLILIDTAGQGQYHHHNIDGLADILSCVDGISTMLCISATTKDIDAYGTVLRYEPVGIDSLVFTKLDETIAHGIIVNVCYKTGKAVRYLTSGMQIPQDLVVADSDEIARAILVKNNAREFDRFRQLVGV